MRENSVKKDDFSITFVVPRFARGDECKWRVIVTHVAATPASHGNPVLTIFDILRRKINRIWSLEPALLLLRQFGTRSCFRTSRTLRPFLEQNFGTQSTKDNSCPGRLILMQSTVKKNICNGRTRPNTLMVPNQSDIQGSS